MILHPSQNHGKKREKTTLIVIHSSGGNVQSNLSWMCNPKSKVSCHYLIGKDGEIYNLVDDCLIAWHAGKSSWKGIGNCNLYSVGIELERLADDKDAYPEPQINSLVPLVQLLMAKYNVPIEEVVGHKDIAPRRKVDPVNFDWETFRAKIKGEEVCQIQSAKKLSPEFIPPSSGLPSLGLWAQFLQQLRGIFQRILRR